MQFAAAGALAVCGCLNDPKPVPTAKLITVVWGNFSPKKYAHHVD